MEKGKQTNTHGITIVETSQNDNPTTSQKTDHREMLNSNIRHFIQTENEVSENSFMKAALKEAVDGAIGDFINCTSNSTMAIGICAVCARETNRTDLTPFQVYSILSPEGLRPAEPHPAHNIFNGMLLHPTGMANTETVNVCMECIRALKLNKIPAFALANRMWISAIPHELAYLTLPERLLIAKYFPAAYIIKLYPKKKGAQGWDKCQMNSGLKGNVSTYQLDQGQITSMIDGTIMPQQARLLAAMIGIMFIGPKNLPDKCLPDIFKVRKAQVQRALEWLKKNNPPFCEYYNFRVTTRRIAWKWCTIRAASHHEAFHRH